MCASVFKNLGLGSNIAERCALVPSTKRYEIYKKNILKDRKMLKMLEKVIFSLLKFCEEACIVTRDGARLN